MQSVIRLHGETQKKKWKVASENESLCSVCDEKGGVLIRCSHEKCSQFFHLDCSLNHGGLSLFDNGLLICECDTHHKDCIFCSCKEKYDPSKAMIYCDSCSDWYHLSCENESPQALNLPNYTCRSCQDLQAHGKTVSKSVKEKNEEKDFRSTCNQNALRIVGFLNDLAVTICPIIDSLSESSNAENNDEDNLLIDISELNNAIEYLTSPPLIVSSEPNHEKSPEEEAVETWEINKLAEEWVRKCYEIKEKSDLWIKRMEELSKHVIVGLDQTLTLSHLEQIQSDFETYKKLELAKLPNITMFDACVCFGDCLKWILDFFQVSSCSSFILLLYLFIV
jgi:hypothetical protein